MQPALMHIAIICADATVCNELHTKSWARNVQLQRYVSNQTCACDTRGHGLQTNVHLQRRSASATSAQVLQVTTCAASTSRLVCVNDDDVRA